MICAQADRSRGRFNPGYGFQFSVGFAPSDWLNQSDAQLRKRLCTWQRLRAPCCWAELKTSTGPNSRSSALSHDGHHHVTDVSLFTNCFKWRKPTSALIDPSLPMLHRTKEITEFVNRGTK
ncbi:hypothetical protein RRG08_019490 [Elysia crispata]|uniref:Uncharacterized protein n=1 Tax=Elysia crispata TaxID=231223 RepID=A0AAE0YHW4_9GAST|nr:hypothetical protein RRG08_019490 [Elysia crispata]